jgi:hypothetical protein
MLTPVFLADSSLLESFVKPAFMRLLYDTPFTMRHDHFVSSFLSLSFGPDNPPDGK